MSDKSSNQLPNDINSDLPTSENKSHEQYGACYINYGIEPDDNVDEGPSIIMLEEKSFAVNSRGGNIVKFSKNPIQNPPSEDTKLFDQNSATVSVSVFLNRDIESVYIGLSLADLFHKIAYLSLIANLVLYAQSYLHCTPQSSVILANAFIACCMIASAFSTIFCLSRFKLLSSTFMGFILYIIGILLIVALPSASSFESLNALAFIFICVGEGTTRAQLFNIGQTQISYEDLRSHRQNAKKLYWLSNLFALLALVVIAALEQYKFFNVAFYMCVALVLLGCIAFVAPWRKYNSLRIPESNAIKLLINIFKEAKIVRQLSVLSFSSIGSSNVIEDTCIDAKQPSSYLDFATIKYGGTYNVSDAEHVKIFLKVSVLLICLIPYWVTYAQFYSTYFYQGLHLNTQMGTWNFPVAWLGLLSIILVTVLTPLLEKVIFPALQNRGIHIPISWRIILGMVAALISIFIAGCVEKVGINAFKRNATITQEIGTLKYLAADVSIFIQLPQYCLLGIGDTLAGITVLSFTQKLCKGPFRRLATGIYYLTISLGHFLALIFVSFHWFPNQTYFSDSSVQKYFFILGGLGAFGIFLFIYVIYRMIDLPFGKKKLNLEK